MTEKEEYPRKVHNDGKRITLPPELQDSTVVLITEAEGEKWTLEKVL